MSRSRLLLLLQVFVDVSDFQIFCDEVHIWMKPFFLCQISRLSHSIYSQWRRRFVLPFFAILIYAKARMNAVQSVHWNFSLKVLTIVLHLKAFYRNSNLISKDYNFHIFQVCNHSKFPFNENKLFCHSFSTFWILENFIKYFCCWLLRSWMKSANILKWKSNKIKRARNRL